MRLPISRIIRPVPHQTSCLTHAQYLRIRSTRSITTTPITLSTTENLKHRIWGSNPPIATGPQIPPAAENVTLKDTLQDPTKFKEYVPRHDGRGLPVVGFVGKLGVRKTENVVALESFPTLNKVTDRELLKAYLRKAVVETYTNVLHGKGPDAGISKGSDLTQQVEVVQSEDGGFKFLYKSESVLNGILNGIVGQQQQVTSTTADAVVKAIEETEANTTTTEPTTKVEEVPVANAEATVTETTAEIEEITVAGIAPLALSPTDAWLSLPLPQSHIFAVHKRILAYTGLRVSDHSLNHSRTVACLLNALYNAAAPPADKLDLLATVPELAELGNVRVLTSRWRPVDKEVEKGRVSPTTKEWLENKRRKEAGEQIEEEWRYKWDEGKYFVA